MSKNKSFYRQILRQYEKDRDTAHAFVVGKRNEIYKKIPEVESIDNELSRTGVAITKSILSAPGQTEELIKSLQSKTDNLLKRRSVLLAENGYSEDDLNPKYKCEVCEDTGYKEDKPCKCFRQKLIEKAYDMSNLRDILALENFDNFDIRYYSKEVSPNEGVSPQENMKKIMSRCMRFANNFDTDRTNLYMYGKSGLGKTFLCHCIAKELLDMGKTVLYITAFQLFRLVEEKRFSRDDEHDDDNEYLDAILNCDLLIIDDLGTEFSTILSSSELFNFINTRLLEKRAMIISTNLSPTDLINQYSDRIVSRIQGSFVVLSFFGEDIRIQKKYGRR